QHLPRRHGDTEKPLLALSLWPLAKSQKLRANSRFSVVDFLVRLERRHCALYSISRRRRDRDGLEASHQHYLRFEWQTGISGSDRLRTFPGTERMARAQLAGYPGPGARN